MSAYPPSIIHQYILKRNAKNGESVIADQFTWKEVPFGKELRDGEIAVKVQYLSCDPTQRPWIGTEPSYMPNVQIGEVMRAAGLGEVAASKNEDYKIGDLVVGLLGWQDWAIGAPASIPFLQKIPTGTPVQFALGICGFSGLTAYFGLFRVAQLRAGDEVLVNSAAGSVGSLVVQLAKIAGARVVAIAGGAAKTKYCTEIGADATIDYKSEDLNSAVKKAFPNGIDVFFDNVGGEQLDAALGCMKIKGRVVVCGVMQNYADFNKHGVHGMWEVVCRRVSMNGFLIFDYAAEFPEAVQRLGTWASQGKLKMATDIQKGLKGAPEHLNRIFTGANIGKQLIQLE